MSTRDTLDFLLFDWLKVEQLVARDALAGVEHRAEGFPTVVGETLALGQGLDLQPVVQQEIDKGAHGHSRQAGRQADWAGASG